MRWKCAGHSFAHAAGADVGGVTAVAVERKNQLVGLRLPRRNFREQLARGRINNADGICKLGGNVKKTIGPQFGAVRAKGLTQVDRGRQFALLQINHINRAAVRPRPSDASVSVDRHVSKATVFGHDDFMSVHAHRNLCQFTAIFGIDDQ